MGPFEITDNWGAREVNDSSSEGVTARDDTTTHADETARTATDKEASRQTHKQYGLSGADWKYIGSNAFFHLSAIAEKLKTAWRESTVKNDTLLSVFPAIDTAVDNSMQLVAQAVQTKYCSEGFSDASCPYPMYGLTIDPNDGTIRLSSRLRSEKKTNIFRDCHCLKVGKIPEEALTGSDKAEKTCWKSRSGYV